MNSLIFSLQYILYLRLHNCEHNYFTNDSVILPQSHLTYVFYLSLWQRSVSTDFLSVIILSQKWQLSTNANVLTDDCNSSNRGGNLLSKGLPHLAIAIELYSIVMIVTIYYLQLQPTLCIHTIISQHA